MDLDRVNIINCKIYVPSTETTTFTNCHFYETRVQSYVGPSPDELEKYPALKDAWENYQTIHKLTIGKIHE